MNSNDFVFLKCKEMPSQDYREAAYFDGNVIELAKILGVDFETLENERGAYYAIGMLLQGVPIKLIGLEPFVAVEFSVLADPSMKDCARDLVINMLNFINYNANEIK